MRTTDFAQPIALAGRPSVPRLIPGLETVAKVWRLLRNRRVTMRLTDLSDSQLADIGLTRADLRDALSVSLMQDSTGALTLAARAHARDYYRSLRR